MPKRFRILISISVLLVACLVALCTVFGFRRIILETRSLLGTTTAMTTLAQHYEKGRGMPPNVNRSVRLYETACERGEMLACLSLGRLCETGDGTIMNFSRAAGLFAKTCEIGLGGGCMSLGSIYTNGNGVQRDATRAAELYRKACDLKDFEGCFWLGVSQRGGHGVPENKEAGAKQMVVAATQLYAECKAGQFGRCSVATNLAAALPEIEGADAALREACEMGDADACIGAASRYDENNEGRFHTQLVMDATLSARYYSRGCDLGNSVGCERLAQIHEKGAGVPRGDGLTVQLRRRSLNLVQKRCKGGNSRACMELGQLYARGEGSVPADLARSREYYTIACNGGMPGGCFQIDETQKAIVALTRMCEAKVPAACQRLSEAHSAGEGVVRNERLAAEFRAKACSSGADESWCKGLVSPSPEREVPSAEEVIPNTSGPNKVKLPNASSPSTDAPEDTVVRLATDITPPKLKLRVEPNYPQSARNSARQGVVILEAIVSSTGDVRSVQVLRKVEPELDDEAIRAVRQWRYEPAIRAGKPVSVYLTVTVTFRLQ